MPQTRSARDRHVNVAASSPLFFWVFSNPAVTTTTTSKGNRKVNFRVARTHAIVQPPFEIDEMHSVVVDEETDLTSDRTQLKQEVVDWFKSAFERAKYRNLISAAVVGDSAEPPVPGGLDLADISAQLAMLIQDSAQTRTQLLQESAQTRTQLTNLSKRMSNIESAAFRSRSPSPGADSTSVGTSSASSSVTVGGSVDPSPTVASTRAAPGWNGPAPAPVVTAVPALTATAPPPVFATAVQAPAASAPILMPDVALRPSLWSRLYPDERSKFTSFLGQQGHLMSSVFGPNAGVFPPPDGAVSSAAAASTVDKSPGVSTPPTPATPTSSNRTLNRKAETLGKFTTHHQGAQVTVMTDHAPMGAMLTSTTGVHYGPTVTRCRALLLPHLHNLRFVHRPGRIHGNVDALSRLAS
ncbi:hypothetical protein OC834_007425 [Tilletia horrida]|nr:hypothetical protein OC834_007425 [Tilletia horrida]